MHTRSTSLSSRDPDFYSSNFDVIIESADGVSFRALRTILIEASPDFAWLRAPRSTAITTLRSPYDAKTVKALLSFMHPVPNRIPTSVAEIRHLLDVAQASHISCAVEALRQALHLPIFMDEDPISVFLIACRHGFKQTAQVAAKRALRRKKSEFKIELYPAFARDKLAHLDMERLENYRKAVKSAARNIVVQNPPSSCKGCRSRGLLVPSWWTVFLAESTILPPVADSLFSGKFLFRCVGESNCEACMSSFARWSERSLDFVTEEVDKVASSIEYDSPSAAMQPRSTGLPSLLQK